MTNYPQPSSSSSSSSSDAKYFCVSALLKELLPPFSRPVRSAVVASAESGVSMVSLFVASALTVVVAVVPVSMVMTEGVFGLLLLVTSFSSSSSGIDRTSEPLTTTPLLPSPSDEEDEDDEEEEEVEEGAPIVDLLLSSAAGLAMVDGVRSCLCCVNVNDFPSGVFVAGTEAAIVVGAVILVLVGFTALLLPCGILLAVQVLFVASSSCCSNSAIFRINASSWNCSRVFSSSRVCTRDCKCASTRTNEILWFSSFSLLLLLLLVFAEFSSPVD
mmetsp:Transcript_30384/g.50860  ORF Transcript_30384/g.50860 Transcript_30384/m.50860 type:complete len:273 (-) Transcript_30384:178-996(-)